MEQATGRTDDLLSVGARYALDTHALCQDVANVIFPTAIIPPTDATISAVTSKLVQLVADIERRLTGEAEFPQQPASWPLLAQSGLLRETDLVDFVLARAAEDRLEARIELAKPSLLLQLLDHPDGEVAEAAQMLFAADSLQRQARGNSYMALPAELLHKLCWRIIAALEVRSGKRSTETIATGRALLAGYDEAQSVKAAARKIVHFIGEAQQEQLLQPEIAGLHLHVAEISAALNLEHDHVLRLIGAGSSATYSVLLSALGVTKQKAAASIMLMRGEALTPREAGAFDSGYTTLDREQARAEIGRWAVARAQYLAFGQP